MLRIPGILILLSVVLTSTAYAQQPPTLQEVCAILKSGGKLPDPPPGEKAPPPPDCSSYSTDTSTSVQPPPPPVKPTHSTASYDDLLPPVTTGSAPATSYSSSQTSSSPARTNQSATNHTSAPRVSAPSITVPISAETSFSSAPAVSPTGVGGASRAMRFGSRGENVRELQQHLIELGYLSPDSATGYFGALTRAALRSFQCDKLSICSGTEDTTGYGNAGPRTYQAIAAALSSVSGKSTTSGTSASTNISTAGVQSMIDALLAQIKALQSQMAALTTTGSSNNTATTTQTITQTTTPSRASCTFNGMSISDGSSITAFQSASVTNGACASERRVCANGVLSGSYQYASCTATNDVAPVSASCAFNGQTIAHGASVTAYQASSVSYGSTCASESRTCTNGSLSGSYTFGSCTVASGPSVNGGVALPLHVAGRYIVDAQGTRVRIKAMNWNGFSDSGATGMVANLLDKQDINVMLKALADAGFNTIRLPNANSMLHDTTVVPSDRVTKNPEFAGLSVYDAYKLFVKRLTDYGFFVIIDNHQPVAGPFAADPADGLWYGPHLSEAQWLADWETVVRDFKDNNRVIGFELRNEIHDATINGVQHPSHWCGTSDADNWREASERAIKKIRAIDPDAITVVEAQYWAQNLMGLGWCQITPSELGGLEPNVVYSVHAYSWFVYEDQNGGDKKQAHDIPRSELFSRYDRHFGYALEPNKPYTAPVWLSEFGYKSEDKNDYLGYKTWLLNTIDYIDMHDMDFGWWAMPRYFPQATNKVSGDYCVVHKADLTDSDPWKTYWYDDNCDAYGLFNADYTALDNDWRMQALNKILKK